MTSTDTSAAPLAAPPLPRTWKVVGLAMLAALVLFAIDVGTKRWAMGTLSSARTGALPAVCDGPMRGTQRLASAPVPVIGEVLSLEYAENCSAAFGLARQLPAPARRAFLAAAALLAVVAIFVALRRGHGGPAFVWGVPLVAAGALGNLLDRVQLGYVVDFLHVQYRPWSFDYPVFNVADIVIVVGVSLLVIGAGRPVTTATPAPGPPPPAVPGGTGCSPSR